MLGGHVGHHRVTHTYETPDLTPLMTSLESVYRRGVCA